jgi:hypothetical protein
MTEEFENIIPLFEYLGYKPEMRDSAPEKV